MSLDCTKEIVSFVRRQGRLAIVGLGNEYRTDDGAGTAVMRLLNVSAADAVDRVAFFEADRNLVGYLPDIGRFQPSGIMFVDAANMGAKPGTILVLTEKQIVEKGISTHENNMDLAIAYFRIVLPEHEVLFVGIQFKSLELSDDLTLTVEVKEAVEELARLITYVVPKR